MLIYTLNTFLWGSAKRNADLYSKYLSVLLIKLKLNCPKAKFTLIGHSLGCYLIYKSLFLMNDKLSFDKIYLCGGAANCNDSWSPVIAKSKSIINLYSKNDIILDNLFTMAEFIEGNTNTKPIGMNSFLSTKIKNINATSFIENHNDYWNKISKWYK